MRQKQRRFTNATRLPESAKDDACLAVWRQSLIASVDLCVCITSSDASVAISAAALNLIEDQRGLDLISREMIDPGADHINLEPYHGM